MPENIEGSYTDIIINGEIYGRVLRTQKDVKPIFLSVGNHIDLETSTEIVRSLVTKEHPDEIFNLKYPTYEDGANHISLIQAQMNFLEVV